MPFEGARVVPVSPRRAAGVCVRFLHHLSEDNQATPIGGGAMTQLLREHSAVRTGELDEPARTDAFAPLRDLFLDELHIEMPAPDTDLLRTAVMDSLMLVELLVAIEDRFGVRLELGELSLDDIRSPRAIVALIARRAGRASLHLDR